MKTVCSGGQMLARRRSFPSFLFYVFWKFQFLHECNLGEFLLFIRQASTISAHMEYSSFVHCSLLKTAIQVMSLYYELISDTAGKGMVTSMHYKLKSGATYAIKAFIDLIVAHCFSLKALVNTYIHV